MTAIKGSAGIKVLIADRLKVTRQTLENYIERDESIGEAINGEREQAIDLAELVVLTNIKLMRERQSATQEPVDTSDSWKLLDKLGTRRGYGEKSQISVVDTPLSEEGLTEDEIVQRMIAITMKKKKK